MADPITEPLPVTMPADFNSERYWNHRFRTDWVEKQGPEQTRFFANVALQHWPAWLETEIRAQGLTLVDFGCATGDAVPLLARHFETTVEGVDLSEEATRAAEQSASPHRFHHITDNQLPHEFDVLFTSNTLEHLKAPFEVLARALERIRKYAVVLVPFMEPEETRQAEHVTSFALNDLPLVVGDFQLVGYRTIDTEALPDTKWLGRQLLLIYGKAQALPLEYRKLTDTTQDDGRTASLDARLALYQQDLALAHDELRALRVKHDQLQDREREQAQELARLTFATHSMRRRVMLLESQLGATREALRRARGLLDAFRVSVRHKIIQLIHNAKFRPGKTALGTAKWLAGVYRRKGLGLIGGLQPDDAIAPIEKELLDAQQALQLDDCPLDQREVGASLRLSAQRNGLVSVVLPVFNQAELLEESILSVLGQTWQRLELIIVNDGSTDGVEQVLQKFKDTPRVLILSGPNQKLPNALNSGFARATGEYWTWTSADNVMLPNQLEVLVAALRAHPEWAMVYSDYQAIDDRGEPLHNPQFRPQNQDREDTSLIKLPSEVTTANLHESGDNFIGASFMYRRSAATAVGDYVADTFGGEDYDFWLRIHSLFAIGHVPQVLYKYRVHDNTLNARAASLGLYENINRLLRRDKERRTALQQSIGFEQIGGAYPLPTSGTVNAAVIAYSARRTRAAADARARRSALSVCVVDVAPCEVAPEELKEFDLIVTASERAWNVVDRAVPGKALLLDLQQHPELFSRIALYRAFEQQHHRPNHLRLEEFDAQAPAVPPKLHVAFQAPSMDKGGLEQVISTLVQAIDRTRFDVSILVESAEPGELGAQLQAKGVRLFTLDRNDVRLEKVIRDARIDVVNLHYSTFGIATYERLGVPLVYTLHNSYTWFSGPEVAARAAALDKVSSLIAVSRQVARYATRRFGILPAKIETIPNGVSSDHFAPAPAVTRRELGLREDDFIFINVASVTSIKAQHALLSAVRELKATHPNVKLLMAGGVLDAPLAEELRARIVTEGLIGNVMMLGHLSHERISGFLENADAFVLPSTHEGWSIALMEAMTHGLPLIVTNTGAAEELVGETGIGLMVDNAYEHLESMTADEVRAVARTRSPRNLPQLVAAMREMIDHPEKWAKRGAAGRDIVRRYTAEAQARAYERVFIETWGALRQESPPPAAPIDSLGVTAGSGVDRAQRDELARIVAQHKSERLVVFPPVIDWSVPIYQRPQHLALQLARLGHPYFFCTPNANHDKVSGTTTIEKNAYLTNRYDALLKVRQPKWFHLLSTDMNYGAPQHPRSIDFVRRELDAGNRFIYEYIDEIHPAISGSAIPRHIYERHEYLLKDERVLVVATASKLYDDVAKHRASNFELVTNGVEYEHFNQRQRTPPAEINDLVKSKKPIIGYFGALAEWFDYELVLEMAQQRDWHVLLIGFDYDGSMRRYGFPERKNPRVIGPIPYKKLPTYAQWFDVATIPFRVNEITESTSPIKLFEYMAMEKPIVTTEMPECRKYRSVHVARSHAEFISMVEHALTLRNDAAHLELLRADAKANTWESKARAISRLMTR